MSLSAAPSPINQLILKKRKSFFTVNLLMHDLKEERKRKTELKCPYSDKSLVITYIPFNHMAATESPPHHKMHKKRLLEKKLHKTAILRDTYKNENTHLLSIQEYILGHFKLMIYVFEHTRK